MKKNKPTKGRILIAEDQAVISLDIQSLMRKLGYSVVGIATSGEDALEIAKKTKPDLVLMDIVLKGKMDGIEAAKKIKSLHGIPSVFLTAYVDQEKVERAKAAQPFGYILKPFRNEELKAVIEMALFRAEVERKDVAHDVVRTDFEMALKLSEQKFRNFFELSADLVCIADIKGRFREINSAWTKILGYSKKELLGRPFLDFIYPGDKANTLKIIVDKLKKGETILTFENRYVCKNGKIIWLEWTSRPSVSEGVTYAIARDITDRKKKEKILTESEEKFRNLFNNSEVGMFRTRLDGSEVLDFNDKYLSILGRTRTECVGKPSKIMWADPKEREKMVKTLKAKGHVEDLECRLIKKSGEIIDCVISLMLYPEQGILEGSIVDITQRKRAEEALRESERKLHEAQKMAHLGYWHWDIATGNVEWSEEVYRIFCLDPKKFIPHIDSILALSPWPEDHRRDKELIDRAIKSHLPGSYEQKFLRPDGSVGHYSSTFQGKYDGKGKLTSIIGTVIDITKRKTTEEALRKSEALYHGLVDTSQDLIWECDGKGRYTYLNSAWERVFGYKTKEMLGKRFRDFQTPKMGKRDTKEFDQLMRGCMVRGFETEHIGKSGNVIHLVFNAKCVTDEKGKAIGTRGTAYDITDRKRSEDELKSISLRQKSILGTVPDIIMEVDRNRVYTWANQSGIDFFGKDVVGKKASHYFVGEQKTFEAVKPVFAGKEETVYVESPQRRKDGQIRLLAWWCRPLKDKDGKVIGALSSAQDITERKNEKESLMKSKRLLDETGRLASVGGWEIELANNRLTWTDEVYRIHEVSDDFQPTVEAAINFYAPDSIPIITKAVKLAIEKAKPFDVQLELITAKKNRIWVRAIGKGIKKNGKVISVHGAFQDITERKKAEEYLRKSDERFRITLEEAKIGVWDWDLKNDTYHASPTYYTMLGYKPEEGFADRRVWLRRVHPKDRKAVAEKIREVLDGGKSKFQYESRIKHADGSYRWVHVVGHTTESDKSGRPIRILGVRMDINRRKLMEDNLRKSEEKYRDIVENSSEMIHSVDTNDRICFSNRRECELLGYSQKELLGKSIGKVYSKDLMRQVKTGLKKLKVDGYLDIPYSQMIKKNGETLDVEIHSIVLCDEMGNFAQTRSIIIDITERVRMEHLHKASELRYRRLFESAKDGILILDYGTGKVVDANPFLSEILDFPKNKLIGKHLWQLGFFKAIAQNKANFLELKRKNFIRYEDLPMETMSGRKIDVEFISNVYDAGGTKVIQCNIRDITDRKNMEELKDQFLNITTHELKSPLIPIRSQCQLFLDGDYGTLSAKGVDAVNMILRNENHLERLVTDILEISRARSKSLKLAFEKVDVGKLIGVAMKNLEDNATAKGVSLVLGVQPDLPFISVDSRRIAKAIDNLLTNAINHTSEKGSVFVKVRKTVDGISISVRDTGIGMSKEVLKQVFTPFFQADKTESRKLGGTGLGLPISQEIVKAHGGRIWAESQGKNKGSTFIFTLPLKK